METPRFLHMLCALCLSVTATFTAAQDYPTRPVRMIVPSSPGAGLDVFSRMLAHQLSIKWGQSVVVFNRPGGSGTIGSAEAAQSEPDGHTILMSTDQSMSIIPHLLKKMPYDPVELTPVTQVLETYFVLVAHPAFQANSLSDLVQYAKQNPKKINYASNGIGSTAHLVGELFKAEAGIDITMIPYKGIAPAQQAALTGEVQLAFVGTSTAPPYIEAGRLKPFAIASPKRSKMLPNVPTFAEAGYPGVESTIWFGIFVRTGTPAPVVNRIYKDIAAILNDPEFREKELVQKGFEPIGSSPAEFATFLKHDREARGRAVKLSGATPQ